MRSRGRLERLSRPSAVAIGNFDGFHAGHRRIVETLVKVARRERLAAVILAFHPHPRVFLGQKVSLINTDAQRMETLESQDVDRLFFIDFSTVAELPAGEFIRNILLDTLRLKALVVGGDFRFGRGREGDLALLSRLAKAGNFELIHSPSVEIEGGRVTSSRIRKLLAGGAIRAANLMLEKPYFIDGIVVKGDGRGRKLGFPTMNIASDNQILPPGVFHTRVEFAANAFASLTNIGHAPTFSTATRAAKEPIAEKLRIETHIPGFEKKIYGRSVRLHFIDKIRDEKKFANAAELVAQIGRDLTSPGI